MALVDLRRHDLTYLNQSLGFDKDHWAQTRKTSSASVVVFVGNPIKQVLSVEMKLFRLRRVLILIGFGGCRKMRF